jgi:hypothetical protein
MRTYVVSDEQAQMVASRDPIADGQCMTCDATVYDPAMHASDCLWRRCVEHVAAMAPCGGCDLDFSE